MNSKYNSKVSSKNYKRLLKNAKIRQGVTFLPHPVGLEFSTNNKPCADTPQKYKQVSDIVTAKILNDLYNHDECVRTHFLH